MNSSADASLFSSGGVSGGAAADVPATLASVPDGAVCVSCMGHGEKDQFASITVGTTLLGSPSIDETTAMFNVLTAIGGLMNLEKTGKGEYIRGNMFEDALSSLAHHVALYTMYGQTVAPMGSGTGAERAYETADWYVYVDASTDENWKKFCDVAGVDKANVDMYSTKEAREKDPAGVEGVMAEALTKMTTSDVVVALDKAGVPVAAINTMREVIDNPHFKANGTVVRIPHTKKMLKTSFNKVGVATKLPVRTSAYNPKIPGWVGKPAPEVGENSVEILKELGYGEEQITDLRKRKIVAPYIEEVKK